MSKTHRRYRNSHKNQQSSSQTKRAKVSNLVVKSQPEIPTATYTVEANVAIQPEIATVALSATALATHEATIEQASTTPTASDAWLDSLSIPEKEANPQNTTATEVTTLNCSSVELDFVATDPRVCPVVMEPSDADTGGAVSLRFNFDENDENKVITDTALEEALDEDEGLWDLIENRMAFMDETVWLNPENLPYNVWGLVEERIDPNRWKPRHRPDFEVVAELPKPGSDTKEVIYYLKCRSAHAFLKIGEHQLFVWNLMDGDHTLREIMYAYRQEYNTMPIFQINQAVTIFKSCRMLDEPDQTVFDRLGQLFEDGAKKLHLNPLYLLTKAKITVDNIDPKVDKLYRYGGWLLYKPFVWIPLLLISFIGVGLALYTLFSGQPLANEIGSLGGGTYALLTYLTLLPLFFIHETSHALTVKHYKREVMGGGFMLLRGMPSMFMDTSDIWMDRNKWHRVMVSVAGPLSNLCVAGILTLIALQLPLGFFSAFLFALAINNIVNAVLNMCPLIELDGYFALMDMMGESGLRAKALKFIRKEFPKRWKQIGKFNRKEWLYLIFGLLALLYTFAITSCMVMFAIRIVIINPILGLVGGVLAMLYFGYRFWYKAKAARKWRKQNEKSEELVAKATVKVKQPAALNSPAVMVIPNPSDKRG